MTSVGILSQASAPAGALWYSWLEDEDFLSWYFAENHRRMQGAYEYVTKWCREHKIPYVPSNSGHFLMLDFQRFLKVKDSESEEKRREAEGDLTSRLMDKGVFIAPGAQYHHPIPGVSTHRGRRSSSPEPPLTLYNVPPLPYTVVPTYLLAEPYCRERGSVSSGEGPGPKELHLDCLRAEFRRGQDRAARAIRSDAATIMSG